MYFEHRPSEKHCLNNLRPFWGAKTTDDVTAKLCKDYAANRPPVAARRDLEVLRAAINHWHKHVKKLHSIPTFWLPEKPESRTRFLTRSDVAKLLWAARRTPHLARFIIVAFYTGSRSGAILKTEWSWIDFDRGIMRRRAPGEIDLKTKRRPPLKIGRRLMSHLKRWKRLDGSLSHLIHYEGNPVVKLRRSWETACARAGVEASAHDLRRTRATILMGAGKDVEVISQALGMTPQVLRDVYAQYDPEWQSEVADVDR